MEYESFKRTAVDTLLTHIPTPALISTAKCFCSQVSLTWQLSDSFSPWSSREGPQVLPPTLLIPEGGDGL